MRGCEHHNSEVSNSTTELDSASSSRSSSASESGKIHLPRETIQTPETSMYYPHGTQKRVATEELSSPALRRSPRLSDGSSFSLNGNMRHPLSQSNKLHSRRQSTPIHSAYSAGDVQNSVPFQGPAKINLVVAMPMIPQRELCVQSRAQPSLQISGMPRRRKNPYPSIRLQPESSPISQEQLAAEVKGILRGTRDGRG